jgi:hypothetical protein
MNISLSLMFLGWIRNFLSFRGVGGWLEARLWDLTSVLSSSTNDELCCADSSMGVFFRS